MANLSKTTKDHDEIRTWAEERGGKPSHVKSTSSDKEVGILRIDFPGYSGGDSLEEISWDDFFEKFDAQDLAMVYQEETADGERSNFNKLISGDSVDDEEPDTKPAAKNATAKKAPSKKTTAVAKKTVAVKKTAPASKSAAKKSAAPAKKKMPAKTIPAKKTPAKKVPAKKAPAKKMPAKKSAPAKKTALKKAPAKKKTGRR